MTEAARSRPRIVWDDTEADTCRKYVLPRLYKAGWTDDQVSGRRSRAHSSCDNWPGAIGRGHGSAHRTPVRLSSLWGGAKVIDWRQYLSSDPRICGGQLCATGTRVLATNILDSLAEGSSREEILHSYPSLRPEHIDAAVAYAAELAHEESLLPLREG